jgi:hypothetical protein
VGGELATAVVSITPTRRGRFFWAAWWTGAPSRAPFRSPDASNGGVASHEEALSAARAATKRALVEIDPRWARGWSRKLRGAAPFTEGEARALDQGTASSRVRKTVEPVRPQSVWDVLGIAPDATEAEIKVAFRRRAFETHPDRGGTDEAFRSVVDAHAKAIARRQQALRRPRKRSR